MPEVCPQETNARTQELLARDGAAIGQCDHCGSYRADGRPPILHRLDCPSYGVIPEWSLPGA